MTNEYATTYGKTWKSPSFGSNGDPDDPKPPHGLGWQMRGSTSENGKLYWFWCRKTEV